MARLVFVSLQVTRRHVRKLKQLMAEMPFEHVVLVSDIDGEGRHAVQKNSDSFKHIKIDLKAGDFEYGGILKGLENIHGKVDSPVLVLNSTAFDKHPWFIIRGALIKHLKSHESWVKHPCVFGVVRARREGLSENLGRYYLQGMVYLISGKVLEAFCEQLRAGHRFQSLSGDEINFIQRSIPARRIQQKQIAVNKEWALSNIEGVMYGSLFTEEQYIVYRFIYVLKRLFLRIRSVFG